jgi:hypothetical protein
LCSARELPSHRMPDQMPNGAGTVHEHGVEPTSAFGVVSVVGYDFVLDLRREPEQAGAYFFSREFRPGDDRQPCRWQEQALLLWSIIDDESEMIQDYTMIWEKHPDTSLVYDT